MKWQDEAKELLNQVPKGLKSMVTMAVEEEAEKAGLEEITEQFVVELRAKMGFEAPDKSIKKVAVVRCHQVAEVCPGTGCLKAWNGRNMKFEGYGKDDQLIGFFTCGGCNGRRVARMINKLKENYDLDVLHLSSCMILDKADYPRCPFKETFKKAAQSKGIEVVEGTHH